MQFGFPCHGLVPLAATDRGLSTIEMPPACPVECHVGS
jgi:hypothetical protein